MSLSLDNLFAELPPASMADEQFRELISCAGLRIERIVSTGQNSPEGFWYDQADGEWILLLQGEAHLRFADETEARHLRTGDCLNIVPHRRHRVDWTPKGMTTIWLAVHYAPAPEPL